MQGSMMMMMMMTTTTPTRSISKNDGSSAKDNDTAKSEDARNEHETTVPPTTNLPTKATTTMSHPNRRNSKKRSRKEMGPETQAELQLSLKQDRYDKLLYMAKKQLMKQAKQVRAFMVQRNIRKLKKQTNGTTTTTNTNNNSNNNNHDDDDDDSDDDDDDDKNNRDEKAPAGPAKSLQPLKDLSLELVVQQAMRQLGLFHANPTPGNVEPPKTLPPEQAKLVSSVLDHKRFQSSLEEWNEKVADFRRFCLVLDDRNNKFASSQDTSLLVPRGKKNKTTSLRPQDNQPTSFFCTSLNDNDDNDNNNNEGETDMMAYGPAATMMEESKPKNRRGQRARKAKALALQAKKEGRQYESLNWREEKTTTNNDNNNSTHNKKRTDHDKKSFNTKKDSTFTKSKDHPAAVPTTNKGGGETANKPVVEDLASQHPSWAAKQQQKSGIVAFQGKKITFD